jgi:hypothetical protein
MFLCSQLRTEGSFIPGEVGGLSPHIQPQSNLLSLLSAQPRGTDLCATNATPGPHLEATPFCPQGSFLHLSFELQGPGNFCSRPTPFTGAAVGLMVCWLR